MPEQPTTEVGRRAFLGTLAATLAAAQGAEAQQPTGRRSVGASVPIEVNPGDRGRLAVFNFGSKPVRGTMSFMDATTGTVVPGSGHHIEFLPSRRGVYHDVLFPTAGMPPGTPNAHGLESWEVMAVFAFEGDTTDVFGSVEVRRPTGAAVAHFRVEIEGVDAGF